MRQVGRVALLACCLIRPLRGQTDATSVPRAPRLSLVAAGGYAWGVAGNTFSLLALTGGLQFGRVEVRALIGTLLLHGGCDAVVPTQCGVGEGHDIGASLGYRFPASDRSASAWTVGVGTGATTRRNTPYLTLDLGRDQAIGRRGLFRVEGFGRHLFDGAHRALWGSEHRQAGIRIGLGIWTPLDRL